MNAPEWNALLIAVGVGVAFWAAIELLSRWTSARRARSTTPRTDLAARRPRDGTPPRGRN